MIVDESGAHQQRSSAGLPRRAADSRRACAVSRREDVPREDLLAAVGLGQLACLRIAVRSRHNRAVLQAGGLYQRLFRLMRVSRVPAALGHIQRGRGELGAQTPSCPEQCCRWAHSFVIQRHQGGCPGAPGQRQLSELQARAPGPRRS